MSSTTGRTPLLFYTRARPHNPLQRTLHKSTWRVARPYCFLPRKQTSGCPAPCGFFARGGCVDRHSILLALRLPSLLCRSPETLLRHWPPAFHHLQLLSAKAISGHTPPPQRPSLTLTAKIARYRMPWFKVLLPL